MSRLLAGPLLVVALVFAISAPAQGQGPGRGGGGYDPKLRFDKMAGTNGYIVIAEVNEFFREPMVKFAKDNNITNGKLTFEQYKQYSEQRQKEGGGGKKGGKGGYGKGGGNSGGGMMDGLRSMFAPKDQTKDKAADARPATSSKPAEKAPSSPSITSRTVMEDELERRPVVYRPGNLPPGLPAWFEKLDKDKDGQVDLGEWRLAGKKISDFEAIDLNKDGLLTPDEVLLHEAQNGREPAVTATPGTGTASGAKDETKGGEDSKGDEDSKK